MATVATPTTWGRLTKASAWMPLAVLPISVGLLCSGWPRWLFMWSLALSIYGGLKWLSFADCVQDDRFSVLRSAGYLLFWPGMDARSFLRSNRFVHSPRWGDWFHALTSVAFGVFLAFVVVPLVSQHRLLAGWTGMLGIVFVLHFGLFQVLSLIWRQVGIDAPPIMDAPMKSSSLGKFWGRRWNVAFRDLAHTYVFRPLVGRWAIAGAMMAVFLVSGVIHDLVISVPAGAGFGLPTTYFTIQGLGSLVERTRLGKRIGLGRGFTGWLFCIVVTTAPLCLLFHRPFVERIVIPMLAALGTI